jgi:hypothetical protein
VSCLLLLFSPERIERRGIDGWMERKERDDGLLVCVYKRESLRPLEPYNDQELRVRIEREVQ